MHGGEGAVGNVGSGTVHGVEGAVWEDGFTRMVCGQWVLGGEDNA